MAVRAMLSQIGAPGDRRAADGAQAADGWASSGIGVTLLAIDGVLIAAGAVVLLWWAWRWRRSGGGDPLAGVARRRNAVVPELLLIPLGIYLVTSLAWGGFHRPEPTGVISHTTQITIGNAAQLAGLVACLWIASRTFPAGIRGFLLGSRGGGYALAPIGLMFLAVLCVCNVLVWITSAVMTMLRHPIPTHPTLIALAEESPSLGTTVVLCAGAVVIAPLAEECFFRGLLQSAVANLVGSRWTAIGVTAAAFAVMHSDQPHAVPPLAALAVLLGYAYERYGSLAAPILLHVAFNLRTIVWQLLLNAASA